MQVDALDYRTRTEIRLREKQSKCSHPSLKCSICGKYEDNLFNEQKEHIKILENIVRHHEATLESLGIPILPYDFMLEAGAIDFIVNKKIELYEKKKIYGNIEVGGLS